MARLPLPLHSYRPSSSARLVNWYAEQAPQEAKSPVRLARCPGIASFATLGSGMGKGRGLFVFNETLYAVADSTLYKISSAGTVTTLGTVAGTGRITAADDGINAVIAADNAGYITNGTTVSLISDVNFLGASSVSAIDSYIVASRPNSRQFASSALADATTWPALNFASKEGAPDLLRGLIVDHREIVLAGYRTTELYYDSGGSGFPFERSPAGFLEIGCAAAQTLARMDNSVFWLANDSTVRRLNGQTPTRISQHGVERALLSYGDLSSAYAFTYQWDGHLFYHLTIPNVATWVFDATTNEWHERATYNQSWWQVTGAVTCYGYTYVQDTNTGAVGYLTDSLCSEFGNVRVDDVEFGSLYADANLISFKGVEVRYRVTKSSTSSPNFTLFKSDNGGDTWLLISSRSMGPIGTKPRVLWFRLGSSRERAYRLRISDPEMCYLEDAITDQEVGSS
jgi:hypothetical protein